MTPSKLEAEVNNANAASDSQHLLGELSGEKLAWMLQKMCEIRYFEEKAEELYIRGQVHGTMHLSIGQEASSIWPARWRDPAGPACKRALCFPLHRTTSGR